MGSGRPLVLCADDYGMNAGVSEGILALERQGRLSALSCMTGAPDWPRAAVALAALGPGVGRGLHLTLTWGRPLGPMPVLAPSGAFPFIRDLLPKALARRLDRGEIEREIERQLDAFSAETGREPDFVDGHEHVHVLPVVREALLAVLSRRGLAGKVWLRDPSDRVGAILARRTSVTKALLITALARGFGRNAAAAGFATNDGFSGFSAFDPDVPFRTVMATSLRALGPRPLVMCHPGCADPIPDAIASARRAEFAYLSSDDFGRLLDERRITLVPAPGASPRSSS